MFHKHQTPEDRLASWRSVRQKNHNTVEECLQEFASVKPIPRYIDYYTPSNWPNVFEIVREGYYCQSGLTLIIAATLVYKEFISTDKLHFDVISNHIDGTDGLILVHDNRAYNFLPGKLVSMEEVLENSTRFNSHILPISQLFS